ncbi:MAG: Stage III sporulation protein AD [Hydrogenibacillus schlegelii]|uniref:Stage III sporulation protein AD n=2 Tax=Hydrogenibacillus schlegelii TaxID=1484 RepID=A0A2T5GC41_HYDSH|nr:MAG: Stage III sporulation protein AD [Hydrogenibacillus schlegelii]
METEMEIWQIVGIGLTATALSLVLKAERPAFAFFVVLVAGVMLFFLILDDVVKIVALLADLAQRAKVNTLFVATILKIVAVAYIADFAAQISRDAGEGSIAGKIELGGKLMILLMAVPIIEALIEAVLRLIP